MPETTSNARVWNGFVCPDCRNLFRVARDHDGRGVVCPGCHRMLRLPGEDDEIPPLTVAQPAPAQQVPAPPPPPEPDAGEEGGEEAGELKRRRRHRRHAEEFDETFAGKREMSPALVRGTIGSLVLMALILGGALWWAFAGGDERPRPEGPVARQVEPEPKYTSETDRAAAERTLEATVIENEIQPVVRRFLEAGSIEELAALVLHPEESLPRMREFYADGVEPPGFSTVIWQADNHRRGEWATVVIETGEFITWPVWLKREDGWKIDWESWAGWSPLGWAEMKREQPTEPTLARALVSEVSYYNFAFADELKWTSYLLEPPGRDDALYGYVPKGGELDLKLQPGDKGPRRPFVLRLRYPEENARDNQVIIEEVISDSWLNPAGDS